MAFEEIFRRFPNNKNELANALSQAGLHCVGCSAATWETLEAGMASHGMSDRQIDEMVAQLNQIIVSTHDESTITLTELAAQKFCDLLVKEKKEGWSLRVGIHATSCCGYEYFLDYSANAQSDDAVFESHGVQIHVQQKVVPHLLGIVIDYTEGSRGAGFKISSPSNGCCCNSHSQHGCCSNTPRN